MTAAVNCLVICKKLLTDVQYLCLTEFLLSLTPANDDNKADPEPLVVILYIQTVLRRLCQLWICD